MTVADVHGPIDFVLIEFPEDRITGGATRALMDLVDRGVVRVLDLMVIGKGADGTLFMVDLTEPSAKRLGELADLAGARSGLLGESDARAAGGAMRTGTVATLIVYENTWAVPFVAAARESGGEVIASARIPATDVMAALDALEAAG
ncbi:hypothetical protein J4573_14650 [Actinomadura barringtoniae]|uniref:DUF1269 domain-containing protein n=1 Tax=Actinomadura barringtoniae TaxID=1427535 RepID=A0A939T6J8_9ACTN|nr:DUF6325 family protein [Actinomadura barringtoniae]MBO2448342.1 hypothetical protein [Actinomadura barringtoniae]